jgi:uncharacterized membrane protein AbrB (regulator of aidB expression)
MSVFSIIKTLREHAVSAGRTRRMAEWLLLLASSSFLVGAMRAAQLPAALMLGPMIEMNVDGRTPTRTSGKAHGNPRRYFS